MFRCSIVFSLDLQVKQQGRRLVPFHFKKRCGSSTAEGRLVSQLHLLQRKSHMELMAPVSLPSLPDFQIEQGDCLLLLCNSIPGMPQSWVQTFLAIRRPSLLLFRHYYSPHHAAALSNGPTTFTRLGWRCPTLSGFSTVPAVGVEPQHGQESFVHLGSNVKTAADAAKEPRKKRWHKKAVMQFSKLDPSMLPTVILVGRPNVGKSALFNRLIQRRDALVYNTPDDHVTRDVREGIAKLGDLRFTVLDSAGLEMAATSGSILHRTAEMTGNVMARSQFAVFLIDMRAGMHPMDLEVGKWLRKHAPGVKTILAMNKSESLDDHSGLLASATAEAYKLGYGDPIAISAETGLGMVDLYEALLPLLEECMLQTLKEEVCEAKSSSEVDESKLPLQLAIVGRPNVGKSTLLNAILQQERVLVGPEAGLTRDSVRAHFQYQGRTIYLVDTAGWLDRTNQAKGPASLSIMQSRKSLLRAHVIALVLDAEEIANAKSSMKHSEVVIARRAVEEGRRLVVIVNKMDLLRGKGKLYEKVIKAVPEEIQTVLPQVTGIPVVFISALEGKGRTGVLREVVNAYGKWCLRLSTARLNRWLLKVMSRHSWKDQASQPKIKYFTQIKARPPTFVAFVSGKKLLRETDIRFLTKSLKDDFDIGGIPIRILQRSVARKESSSTKSIHPAANIATRTASEKRAV